MFKGTCILRSFSMPCRRRPAVVVYSCRPCASTSCKHFSPPHVPCFVAISGISKAAGFPAGDAAGQGALCGISYNACSILSMLTPVWTVCLIPGSPAEQAPAHSWSLHFQRRLGSETSTCEARVGDLQDGEGKRRVIHLTLFGTFWQLPSIAIVARNVLQRLAESTDYLRWLSGCRDGLCSMYTAFNQHAQRLALHTVLPDASLPPSPFARQLQDRCHDGALQSCSNGGRMLGLLRVELLHKCALVHLRTGTACRMPSTLRRTRA